jgi:hypothetical protein
MSEVDCGPLAVMERELERLVKPMIGEVPMGIKDLDQECPERDVTGPAGRTARSRLNLAYEQ